MIGEGHQPTAVEALHRDLDLGKTYIDTAEMHGDAEIVVATFGEQLFISTRTLTQPLELTATDVRL